MSELITLNGIDETSILPPQMAAVILGLTSNIKTRGRKALAGICVDGILNGEPTAALLVALTIGVAGYITRLPGATGDVIPGTWSRKTNVFHPFISGIADVLLGTMRRRKPGVGI